MKAVSPCLCLYLVLCPVVVAALVRLDLSNSSAWTINAATKTYGQSSGTRLPISFVVQVQAPYSAYSVSVAAVPASVHMDWCVVTASTGAQVTVPGPVPGTFTLTTSTQLGEYGATPVYLTCMPSQISAGVTAPIVVPAVQRPTIVKVPLGMPLGARVGLGFTCVIGGPALTLILGWMLSRF